jgi:DNA-binding beta-propeller fold protein YncE
VLRRLDLASLETSDEHRLTLPARAAPSRREHAVRVHAAGDFSRFAVIEYVEDGATAPGHVYMVDAVAGPSCTVSAPPTAYGVAFSLDGQYVYLGSAQRGTISRIDLASCRIDKQVAAPHFLHHLVVSRSGTKLFAFASSSSYAVFDLPDLKARVDAAHPAGVAAAMAELHGDGIASLDGAFFVVPEADDRRKAAAPDRSYVIARLID